VPRSGRSTCTNQVPAESSPSHRGAPHHHREWPWAPRRPSARLPGPGNRVEQDDGGADDYGGGVRAMGRNRTAPASNDGLLQGKSLEQPQLDEVHQDDRIARHDARTGDGADHRRGREGPPIAAGAGRMPTSENGMAHGGGTCRLRDSARRAGSTPSDAEPSDSEITNFVQVFTAISITAVQMN
jgi:hypothetical protein